MSATAAAKSSLNLIASSGLMMFFFIGCGEEIGIIGRFIDGHAHYFPVIPFCNAHDGVVAALRAAASGLFLRI